MRLEGKKNRKIKHKQCFITEYKNYNYKYYFKNYRTGENMQLLYQEFLIQFLKAKIFSQKYSYKNIPVY